MFKFLLVLFFPFSLILMLTFIIFMFNSYMSFSVMYFIVVSIYFLLLTMTVIFMSYYEEVFSSSTILTIYTWMMVFMNLGYVFLFMFYITEDYKDFFLFSTMVNLVVLGVIFTMVTHENTSLLVIKDWFVIFLMFTYKYLLPLWIVGLIFIVNFVLFMIS